ncbi:MAG: YdcF family protein [Pseudanabaenaceae cyanobacterium bins.68]|nr:YdcF family protein [Pseudanabaenaceae cyanobacterium bins.68]
MSRRRHRRPLRKTLISVVVCLVGCSFLAFNLLGQLYAQRPHAAILVLGGSPIRETFAASYALDKPNLSIWVSSGSPREYAEHIFTQAGIGRDRLHLDYRAVDTLTNFTSLVDEFQTRKINQIYLITEKFHMPRAKLVGNLILGSRGIKLKPIAVASPLPPERTQKVIRDLLRAILWLLTGAAPTMTDLA